MNTKVQILSSCHSVLVSLCREATDTLLTELLGTKQKSTILKVDLTWFLTNAVVAIHGGVTEFLQSRYDSDSVCPYHGEYILQQLCVEIGNALVLSEKTSDEHNRRVHYLAVDQVFAAAANIHFGPQNEVPIEGLTNHSHKAIAPRLFDWIRTFGRLKSE